MEPHILLMKSRHFTTSLLTYNSAHIQQALGVLEGALGENYILRNVFETYIYDDDSFSGKVALIVQDHMTEDVVGVLVAEIVLPETFKASLLDSFDLVKELPAIQQLDGKRIGLIKSVAVAPSFQRQGIGMQLVKDAIKKLKEHGTEAFYALGWVSKERGCHIQGVLEALDFRVVSQSHCFWYKDSIHYGYVCPSCGYPCQCSARLFVRLG
jgi:ribosomal protein S18 acetylase RimI-like enzyme